MTKGKVLIAAPVHAVLTEGLMAQGYELEVREKIVQEEAAELVKDCIGIVTSTRLVIGRSLIDAAPNLEWIGRMGSGMEIIDTAYAAEKGITCFSSPEGNCNAVAEHAMGMLLSLTKKITSSHIEVANDLWKREPNRGIELEGRTLGIIGFGHTGRAFAKKLQGFDMQILAHDIDESIEYPPHVTKSSLEEIQNRAEIISFHLPLNEMTRYYFDSAFLEKMANRFLLINTSRGEIVDIKTIYEGLKRDKIAGVALDVLEGEPLEKMSAGNVLILKEMLKLPQTVVTPHIAGYSHEAVYKMSETLLRKIVTLT